MGYCQGLNFIVAHLLRHLSEEQAFWTLCCLIESILPIDYYCAMIGVLIDQRLFLQLIHDIMPQLAVYLDKLNLDPSLVSLQWFVCLFSYNLQPEVSDVIWDHLFLQGSKTLFKAGMAIMSLVEKNIMTCDELRIVSGLHQRVAEAFAILEKEPRSFTDVGVLVQTMNLWRFKSITNDYVYSLRQKRLQRSYDELNRTNEKKRKLMHICNKLIYVGRLSLSNILADKDIVLEGDRVPALDELVCDPRWPVCMFDHLRKSRCVSYFAFHTADPFDPIEDYFSVDLSGTGTSMLPSMKRPTGAKSTEQPGEETKLTERYVSLLIERDQHYCQNPTFVEKVNAALRLELPLPEMFPTEMVDPPIGEEVLQVGLMDRFMKHVMYCHLPAASLADKLAGCKAGNVKGELEELSKKSQPLGEFVDGVLAKVGGEEFVKSTPSVQFLTSILNIKDKQ